MLELLVVSIVPLVLPVPLVPVVLVVWVMVVEFVVVVVPVLLRVLVVPVLLLFELPVDAPVELRVWLLLEFSLILVRWV